MNANIDLKSLKPRLKKLLNKVLARATFLTVLLVLVAYLLVVWRISGLATAEPPPEAQTTVANSIPKVNKTAVEQILKLEENNSEVHSLFNEARNNPFQE